MSVSSAVPECKSMYRVTMTLSCLQQKHKQKSEIQINQPLEGWFGWMNYFLIM